jgi:hypothetical protein
MLCIACGAEMRIARIEQDAAMKAAGYEHQTCECLRCRKTERRLAFSGDRASWPVEYRWALASLSGAKPTCVGNDQKKGVTIRSEGLMRARGNYAWSRRERWAPSSEKVER